MPDDNRFAGIGDRLEQPEQSESESGASADDPTDDATGEESTADEGQYRSEEAGGGTTDDPADGPAFAFDETSAKSLYVRDGTLELFEDTEFEVEATLRSNHGIRDLTSREFHDAVVRVAADHVEEIAARIDNERAGDE
jgi:hypothetical protein